MASKKKVKAVRLYVAVVTRKDGSHKRSDMSDSAWVGTNRLEVIARAMHRCMQWDDDGSTYEVITGRLDTVVQPANRFIFTKLANV